MIVLFSLVTSAFCRPDGAPVEACTQLIPQHPPNVPMAGSGPFTLNVTIPSIGYIPGNGYEVTLSSDNPNVTFRGFVIQARTQPENNLVGSFIIVDEQTRLQECQLSGEDPVSTSGTITHTSRTNKTSVSLRWVAPSAGTGPITFIYSVVANYSTYWVRTGSELIFEDTGGPRQIDDLHYFECGSSRACFREPYNCRGAICTYAATWMVDEDADIIEVEMIRNSRGWIALGFSDDNRMGEDDVFVCQSEYDGSSVIVKDTYNPKGYEPNKGEEDQDDITYMEWASSDSIILCRFRRTLSGSNNNVTIDKDLSTGQYYLLFAYGNTFSDSRYDGVGGMHVDIPKMTTEPRSPADVSEVEIVRQNPALIKAHGAFMIFTWYFIAPLGIFLALFYKEAFPNGLWFYGHIIIMITTIVFMFIGLILILVHAEGRWIQTDGNQGHQVIGLIVIISPCLNAILGIFKGNPDGHYRWLFNLVHGTNGFVIALVLAMINILLGLFRLSKWTAMEDHHLIRKSLYVAGSSFGLISMIFFLLNVYRLIYHKRVPRPQDQAGGDDDTRELVKDDGPTPAPDYVCRISLGIVLVIPLFALAIATIVLMGIS